MAECNNYRHVLSPFVKPAWVHMDVVVRVCTVHIVHACRCLFWTPVCLARWDRKPVLFIPCAERTEHQLGTSKRSNSRGVGDQRHGRSPRHWWKKEAKRKNGPPGGVRLLYQVQDTALENLGPDISSISVAKCQNVI